MKYSKYKKGLKRRESWKELVDRNKNMHTKKFTHLAKEIEAAYSFVYDKKVLPSMRSMQFAGKPIEISPNRVYNCAYLPIDDIRSFSETMFLLLGGTGVGYSVQRHHIEKLPEITKPNPNKHRRFLIGDSIEGWADAVKVLIRSYFEGGSTIIFDFSDIRPKGAELVTSGGKAPGPQPLKECLVKIEGILSSKENNTKLSSIEVHDIVCHIADAVLAGGIRRAALISLFSADDEEMIAAKSGAWWETNPQRGRANNSAVLLRNKVTKEFFMSLWEKIKNSGSGEPGIYQNNDKDWGTNPCCFIGDTLVATADGRNAVTIKPSGTSSLALGTSSGIHAWHNDYYIRRIRVGKNEAIYTHLSIHHPELIEDEYFRPHDTAVISVPQKAPEGAILRTESAIDLLERVKFFYENWIKPGHKSGQNTHNISATVSIKDKEWESVGEWMWENRDSYNGLSVLPYSDHTYIQAPFEDCTKEKYEEMLSHLTSLDLTQVVEFEDMTDLRGEVACGADGCVVV